MRNRRDGSSWRGWGLGATTLALGGLVVSMMVLEAMATLPAKGSSATAFQNMRKFVQASTGTLGFLYPATAGLTLAVSRDDAVSWTTNLVLPSSTQNNFADALISPANDIYLVMTGNQDGAGADHDVKFVKLAYQPATDDWVFERQMLLYDASASTAGFNAVLALEDNGRLWAAYRYVNGSNYSLMIVSSIDDGYSWQQAIEVEPPGTNKDEIGILVPFGGDRLAVIYYHQGLSLRWRWRWNGDPPQIWQPLQLLVTKKGGTKSDFSAVGEPSGRIHLLYPYNGVHYRQFDGSTWLPVTTLTSDGSRVSVSIDGTTRWAFWRRSDTYTVWMRRYNPWTSVWEPEQAISDPAEPHNDHPTSIAVGLFGSVAAWTTGASSPHYIDIVGLDPAPAPPPSVTSLTLVNSTTDSIVGAHDPLADGATVDLFAVGNKLNIRANTGVVPTGSIKFGLDGNPSYRIENSAPFALAGHSGSNYFDWTPSVGSHTVTATPYSGPNVTGTAGTPFTVAFTVIDTTPTVTGFTLVNAATDTTVAAHDPLVNGATVDRAAVGSQLNIRANTSPATVGSVRFGLDGNASYRTENVAPYALAGHNGADYFAWTPSVGSHTVTATPYSGANATGTAGTPVTITFNVVDTTPGVQSVTSFTLINAATDTVIATFDPLVNGATFDLASVGTNLNIRANTNPATVGSVRFGLDGNASYRTENAAPYALGGHNGADYFAWTPSVGSHTLTGTPYTSAGATGTAGTSLTISFTVVDSSPPGGVNKNLISPAATIDSAVDYNDSTGGVEDSVAVWIAPNPADSLLFVTQKSGNKVDVWSLQTNLRIRTLTGFNKPNGIAVDQAGGAAYVADRLNYAVKKFLIADVVAGNLTPALVFGTGFTTSKEPNSIAVLPQPGGALVYVTYNGSSTKYVRAFRTDGVLDRSWSMGSAVIEPIAADIEHNRLYVADRTAKIINVYTPTGTLLGSFGSGLFTQDIEGIEIYRCGSDGYILVSDQDADRFLVFDRLNWQFLASFKITSVNDTDGITIGQAALPGFATGALFTQDGDVLVRGTTWSALAAATGMSTCQP